MITNTVCLRFSVMNKLKICVNNSKSKIKQLKINLTETFIVINKKMKWLSREDQNVLQPKMQML
jgi:uncharacterized pyridoxamine 5'-phosphate oxidase family protein